MAQSKAYVHDRHTHATLDIYSHVLPDMQGAAVEALNMIFSKKSNKEVEKP